MNPGDIHQIDELHTTSANDVPEGWAKSPLKAITKRITKGATPTSYGFKYQDKGIKFVKVENLKDGRINCDSIRHFISEEANLNQSRSILQAGDLLFSIAGTIGKTCLVRKEDLPANTNQALAIIHGTSDVLLPDLLQLQLRSEIASRQITSQARGGSMNNISLGDVRSIEVCVPPLAEQKRIVAKVEELLARVNATRERLTRVKEILKRFRQSTLAAACSGRLTADWREEQHIDYDWLDLRIDDIGVVGGGITMNRKRKDFPLRVPYLRVANVYENELRLDDVGFIGVTQAEFERTLLREGDLLFVEGNGSIDQIGRVALWDNTIQPCVHQNHLIKFRASEKVDPRYTLLWMMSPFGRASLLEAAVSTAGLYNLSISKIENLPIKLACLKEQQEIVRRVEGLFKLSDAIKKRVAVAQERAERLTRAILARAFRGELVTTEAELARQEGRSYEPASALLDKIK